jgi:hypothetical protein
MSSARLDRDARLSNPTDTIATSGIAMRVKYEIQNGLSSVRDSSTASNLDRSAAFHRWLASGLRVVDRRVQVGARPDGTTPLAVL